MQNTHIGCFVAVQILWLISLVLWFGAFTTIGEWISAYAGYDINKYAFADLRYTWIWFLGLMIPAIAGVAGWIVDSSIEELDGIRLFAAILAATSAAVAGDRPA